MAIWIIFTFFFGVFVGKRVRSKRAGSPDVLKEHNKRLVLYLDNYRNLVEDIIEKYDELKTVPQDQRDDEYYKQVEQGKKEAVRTLRNRFV